MMNQELKDLYERLAVLEAEKAQSKYVDPLRNKIKQMEEKSKNAD